MEKTPPAPGLRFSGVAKIALVFWYASGTLSRTEKNSFFARGENPSTTLVTSRISS